MAIHKTHEIYQPKDFSSEEIENGCVIADAVVNQGVGRLQVVLRCRS